MATKQRPQKPESVFMLIADGLDASVDGRGWEKKHEDAKNLADAAPDMVEALTYAAAIIKVARRYFPKSVSNHDRFDLENTNAAINKALAKARGELKPIELSDIDYEPTNYFSGKTGKVVKRL